MPRPRKKREESGPVESEDSSRPGKDVEEEGSESTSIKKGTKEDDGKAILEKRTKREKVSKKDDEAVRETQDKRGRKGSLKDKTEAEGKNENNKKVLAKGAESKSGKKVSEKKDAEEDKGGKSASERDQENLESETEGSPGKRKGNWKTKMDSPAPARVKRKRKALIEKYEKEIATLPEKRRRKVTWKLLEDFEFFDVRKPSKSDTEEEVVEEKSKSVEEKLSSEESEEEEEEKEKKKPQGKRRRKSTDVDTEEDSDSKSEGNRKKKKKPKKGTGTSCSIFTCNNYHGATHGSDISYYKFPNNPKLREEWLKRCGRDEDWSIKFPRICSEHFTEDQFEDDIRARIMQEKPRKKLKPDAIPNRRLRRTPTPEKEPEVDPNQQKIIEEESRKKFIEEILKEYEEKQREEEAKEKAKESTTAKGVIIGPDVRILTEAEIKKRIAEGAHKKTPKSPRGSTLQSDEFGDDRCGDIIEVTEVMMNEDEVVEITADNSAHQEEEEEDLAGCERCNGINIKFIVEDHKQLKGQVQSLKDTLKEKEKECEELKIKVERIESLVAILCTQIPEEQEPLKFSYYEGRRALFVNKDSDNKNSGPRTEIRLC